MALQPEIMQAIDEIVNEAIVVEDEQEIVELNLTELDGLSDNIKEILDDEFDGVLELMEFKHRGYQLFSRWYVDAKIYYHTIIDSTRIQDGILELRFIDPRRMRKVREVEKRQVKQGVSTVEIVRTKNEYYVYAEDGYGAKAGGSGYTTGAVNSLTGYKIPTDAVVYCTSGLVDESGRMVLGYLHQAIKPLNQLRAMEDAAVIYRLTRAPERRIFYIDVGNLPKPKAEQYLREQMVRHKNRLVYDSTTGEIRDDRKFMTTYEDYWLARREGGKGTEISTLPGGQNLGEMEDVYYFQKRLYRSLHVPIGRLSSEDAYSGLGPTVGEITRDEVNFASFITRLRTRFSGLFLDILGRQLVLKRIMSVDDWEQIRPKIKFRWARQNYFTEMKDMQVRDARMNSAMAAMPYVGRYFSNDWVRKAVFQQTDEDIREQDRKIKQEAPNPQFMQVDPETGMLLPSPFMAGPPMPAGPDTGPSAMEQPAGGGGGGRQAGFLGRNAGK